MHRSRAVAENAAACRRRITDDRAVVDPCSARGVHAAAGVQRDVAGEEAVHDRTTLYKCPGAVGGGSTLKAEAVNDSQGIRQAQHAALALRVEDRGLPVSRAAQRQRLGDGEFPGQRVAAAGHEDRRTGDHGVHDGLNVRRRPVPVCVRIHV